MYVCMYSCMQHACMYIFMLACMYVYIYACMYVCNVRMCVHMILLLCFVMLCVIFYCYVVFLC